MISIPQKYKKIIKKINQLEEKTKALKDEDFKARTSLLKMRLFEGASVDSILPEAFALVREAAKRILNLRAFDVQLMGAIATHEGQIVEMKTGEGKTLTIVFSAYLNALEGKGVHVVTANDYLAERDSQNMGRVYRFLGLGTACVVSTMNNFDRQVGYASDVTYITNNEVCFDFLRDNMVLDINNRCQRELNFAIVDEADSVLIDEAQTPLVISADQTSSEEDKQLFKKVNQVIASLERELDYIIKEKEQQVILNPAGVEKIEKLLGVENIYGENVQDYLFFVERLLRAHALFKKDKDYIVEEDNVIIVDEFTGRLMPQHRYYQGLHQAIEAKEGVSIKNENETLASISFQHFFQRYKKMAGLTGTAQTSEEEFWLLYKKNLVVVPTNKPIIRQDFNNRFFASWQEKIEYLAWATQEYYFKQQPVLIGTRSIVKSQQVQSTLIESNIPSDVLNAKNNRREAETIARAGQLRTVTVATNMAGRGTDIELSEKVKTLGGLWVYGTERHNSRRIDNQLIGRSGRQGDPGLSQFLISADDELIRIYFKKEYQQELKKYADISKGIESKKLDQFLLKAQKKMEATFFDQRVLTFEFDKVLDVQRKAFYRQRERVLSDTNLKEETLGLLKSEIFRMTLRQLSQTKSGFERRNLTAVAESICALVGNKWFKLDFSLKGQYQISEIRMVLEKSLDEYFKDIEDYLSAEKARDIEKITTLKVLDVLWAQHLKKAQEIQEAALIDSISRGDFFQEYEIQLAQAYRQMWLSLPTIVCKTFFKTVSRLWQNGRNNN